VPSLPPGALFAQLDAKALDDIRRYTRPRRYAAGDVICREGDRSDSLLVLQRGLADVHVTSKAEKRKVHLRRLRAGDIVGEVGVVTGLPRSATVIASSDTGALEIGREDFTRLLANHPRLEANLTRLLGARLASGSCTRTGTGQGVVALVVDGKRSSLAGRVLEAAHRAAPRPVPVVDVRDAHAVAGVAQALEHLHRLEAAHETVVVVVSPRTRGLTRLLERAQRVIALASRDEALALAPRLRAAHRVVDFVLLGGAGGESIPSLAECRVVRRCSDEPTAADIAWLGRHLSRAKLGLALGAGGAKAFAHAGVIDALQRAGYVVDHVAGSSMGAVIAVCLARGMAGADIANTLSEQWAPRPVVDEIFRNGATGDGVRVLGQLLREMAGDRSFADLEVPATVMTADLTGRCPAPLTSGPLWDALMAALAIPGLYPPWLRGEQRLVDAVSLTPVPIESASAGGDVTIAVNLFGRESLPSWPSTAAGVDAVPTAPRPGRVRDTVVEVLQLAQLDFSASQTARADVPVTPQFGPGTWRDMHLGPLFFEAGATAAEAQLSRLAALARPCRAAA